MNYIALAKWSGLVFLVSGAVALGASVTAWKLPEPLSRPELREEPLQTALSSGQEATLVIPLHGHQYAITPRFNYHLTGLVVSKTDAMGWSDISHKDWGDFLNTNDICVLWGSNAESLDLSQFSFTHGDWTCYVSTHSSAEYQKFRMDAFANNHILPSTPEITRAVQSVRIGDQIEIDGQLVDYSIDGGGSRHTSIVRTDTGNGACEIIYVTSFRFIARHHEKLYRLAHFAMNVMVLSLVLLGLALFVLPFLSPSQDQ